MQQRSSRGWNRRGQQHLSCTIDTPPRKKGAIMSNFVYGISYSEKLKRRREATQALRDATPKPPTLHERIETWLAGLSDEDKSRAWSMREFREIFGDTPQRIGGALFELGWTRKRMWRDDRPTARYWLKE